MVTELAEVLAAQAVERSPVELRLAADVVVDAGRETLAVLVVPGVLRDVAVLDEDLVGVPVLDLAREPVAAFEDEDPLAGRCQVSGEGPATGATADDDDVEVLAARHRAAPPVTAVAPTSSSSQVIRDVPLRSRTCGARSLPK